MYRALDSKDEAKSQKCVEKKKKTNLGVLSGSRGGIPSDGLKRAFYREGSNFNIHRCTLPQAAEALRALPSPAPPRRSVGRTPPLSTFSASSPSRGVIPEGQLFRPDLLAVAAALRIRELGLAAGGMCTVRTNAGPGSPGLCSKSARSGTRPKRREVTAGRDPAHPKCRYRLARFITPIPTIRGSSSRRTRTIQ